MKINDYWGELLEWIGENVAGKWFSAEDLTVLAGFQTWLEEAGVKGGVIGTIADWMDRIVSGAERLHQLGWGGTPTPAGMNQLMEFQAAQTPFSVPGMGGGQTQVADGDTDIGQDILTTADLISVAVGEDFNTILSINRGCDAS